MDEMSLFIVGWLFCLIGKKRGVWEKTEKKKNYIHTCVYMVYIYSHMRQSMPALRANAERESSVSRLLLLLGVV